VSGGGAVRVRACGWVRFAWPARLLIKFA